MDLISLDTTKLETRLNAGDATTAANTADITALKTSDAAMVSAIAAMTDTISALAVRVTVLEGGPQPSPREQLLAWLDGLSGRVVSGQHVTHGLSLFLERYETHIDALYAQTGYYPGLLGVSLVGLNDDTVAFVAPMMIDYARRGGLVQADYHMDSPFTGGIYQDTTNANLIELLTPTTDYYRAAHDRYMATLDQVADLFETLRDAGVVVLWRPFHEANYNQAFWWSWGIHGEDVEPFIALWRHMHDYFTRVRDLDNIIWVFAPANTDETRAVEWMYPGGDVVDVVGLSLYGRTPVAYPRPDLGADATNYTAMLQFAKPFALTECGPRVWNTPYDNSDLIAAIRGNFPSAAYFMRWHSWAGNPVAIVHNSNAAGLLGDPWVVNRPAFFVS